MGTFSPETCLELVPKLSRDQVDREYEYFGGTVKLPTKDKRYKLREYLVNLRDAQKVGDTGVVTSGMSASTATIDYAQAGYDVASNTYTASATDNVYSAVVGTPSDSVYSGVVPSVVPPPPPNEVTVSHEVAYLTPDTSHSVLNSGVYHTTTQAATNHYMSQPASNNAVYQYQTAADQFTHPATDQVGSYTTSNSDKSANHQPIATATDAYNPSNSSTATDAYNPSNSSTDYYLQSICHQINVNVLQLKGQFEDYLSRRGDNGNHTAVDMDVSDPGEDMDLSDAEMTNNEKLSVKRRNISANRPSYGARGGPPLRGGGSTNRSAHRGGQPPNRGEVGYPARGPSHHARGGGGGSNGRNISPYNKPEPWSRDANKSETWSRDTSSGGPPPSNRGQPRGKFSSARGGAPALKRDIGFRGLGNKEEIPHNLKPIDWQSIAMEEVHKVQYNENSITKSRPKEEIDSFREKHRMTVSENCPNPILSFNEVSFPPAIKDVIRSNGFKEPTPIQSQGWPVALSGRDLIGIAQTGSGKTLGFTLPGLIHVNAQPPGNGGPIALCLCPTRELAQQVMGVCEEFTRAMRIRSVCLYGGASKYQQISQISEGVDFAIATPGRLIDLLDTKKVSLKRCSYLVLDEADRMLDMGFEPQITAIISQIRPDRHTLMWSATWPSEVQELAQKFLINPFQISIGSDKLVANHAIKQVVMVIEGFEKFAKLKGLLTQIDDDSRNNKTLIFTDTKRMADDIADELKGDGWPVEAMHGDKRQEERERILRDFKRGLTAILVATDVASRGIDISDITHVINFDYPNTSEDYIHRIGRTARASRTGTAYTFITPNDSRNIDDLVDVLKEAGQDVPNALMMMKECFGGSKPEKKVWVPKALKRRQDAQAREAAERKRLAGDDRTPMKSWDDEGKKEDSDSEIETRKRSNWPETDDDWAALYGDIPDTSKDKKDISPDRSSSQDKSADREVDIVEDKISIVADPIDWTSLENG